MPLCEKTAAASFAGRMKKAAVQIAVSLSPSVDIKHRLRGGARGLQSIFEATRLQKVSSSVSNLAMIFLQKVENITSLLTTGGANHLSGCGSSYVCVRVSLCLCGRGRDSAALYLYFSGQVKFFALDPANVCSLRPLHEITAQTGFSMCETGSG